MKKKEAVQKTLEQLDREQQAAKAEKERIESEKRQDGARPSLIKRVGVGLLDFAFAAIVTFALVAISYVSFFKPLGYDEAVATVYQKHEDSHLFHMLDGKYVQIVNDYDENKTASANYDVPVTYFYSTDERAIKDNKLEKYIDAKLSSDYYTLDSENNCVLKDGVMQSSVKTFLEGEYSKAVEYFFEDPELVDANKAMFNIMTWTMFFSVTISSAIFYIVVPAIDKHNRTFGYMIGKMMVVSAADLKPISKGKVILRNIIFIVISYVSAVTIYMLTGSMNFVIIPLFANTIILCVTKRNYGLHDFAVSSCVINRSMSNEFTILDNIKQMGDNNNQ